MSKDEEWRAVHGYEGKYEVSSDGRVRSIDRVVACCYGSERAARGQEISTHLRNGYFSVRLWSGGASRLEYVHALVCMAWHGRRPIGNDVAHEDGDPLNNDPGNLSWKTHADNQRDMIRHGTSTRGKGGKLTKDAVLAIRLLEGVEGPVSVGSRYGIDHSTVCHIWKRKIWRWLE